MNNNELWKKVPTKNVWLDSVLKSPQRWETFHVYGASKQSQRYGYEKVWIFLTVSDFVLKKDDSAYISQKKPHQNVCNRYVVPSQMITSRKPSTNLNKTCQSLLREYFPVSKDGLNQTPRTLNYVNIKTLLYMSYPAAFRPILCWLIWKKRLGVSLKADEFLLRYFIEFMYDFISHQIIRIRIIRYIFCFYTHKKIEALMSKTSLIHILAPLVGWKQQVRHLSKQAWNTQHVGVCRGHVTWVFSTALWNWVLKHLCLGDSIPMTVDAQYGIETSILSFPSAAHNGFETLYSGLDMRMRRRVLHGRSKHALVSPHYTQIIVHVCKSSYRYIVLVRNT